MGGALMEDLQHVPGPAGRSVFKSRRIEQGIREDRARTLAWMIAATHPDDARQILTAALLDLSAGAPPLPFIEATREDAQ